MSKEYSLMGEPRVAMIQNNTLLAKSGLNKKYFVKSIVTYIKILKRLIKIDYGPIEYSMYISLRSK